MDFEWQGYKYLDILGHTGMLLYAVLAPFRPLYTEHEMLILYS